MLYNVDPTDLARRRARAPLEMPEPSWIERLARRLPPLLLAALVGCALWLSITLAVILLLTGCGGEAPPPAQPCAYVDSDPVYCACMRTCSGESQCVMHVGRCTDSEPGQCPIATVKVRTSTALYSLALGEPCGPEPTN